MASIFKKLTRKASVVLTLVALSSFLIPRRANAEGWLGSLLGIGDIAGSVIGWIAFVVNYILSLIAAFFVAIETWVIQIVLQMNTTIVNSTVVQSGFSVTLSIANLGFVAAIIVIAIATILRSQTDGIKQILWKLVIAALLVNFSLVIAGAVINFADQMTLSFLKAFPGAGGGFGDFADSIASAYQPQQYLNPQDLDASAAQGVVDDKLKGIGSVAGASLGKIIAPIAAAWMGLLGNLMMVIVLGALAVLLLIRYMYLTILLILMPLAWVSWIFPAWQGQWTKWWQKFFRWTLFAPISMFFLWLVLSMGTAIHNKTQGSPFSGVNTEITSASSGASGGLFELFGKTMAPILGTFLNGLVLSGLTIGGLIAANQLSILGAGAAMGVAQSAAKGLGRVTVKGGKRFGAWGMRKTGADSGLQNLSNKLAGTGALGRVAARPLSKVSSAIKSAGTEKLVAESAKDLEGLTTKQIAEQIGTMNHPARIAALRKLDNEKALDLIPRDTLKRLVDPSTKDLFTNYGYEKLHSDVRNKTGLKFEKLAENLDKAETAGDRVEIDKA